MSASSAPPMPLISPAEMQILVARAGLSLNPGQMADLVLGWRQLVGLLAAIPRDRKLADDQAYVFRLPAAPPSAPAPEPAAKRAPARKAPAKKAAVRKAPPAKAKPKARAKPAARKAARRRR